MPSLQRATDAIGTAWRFLVGETNAARDALPRVFEDNFDGLAVIGEDGTILAASRVASALLLGQGGGSIVGRAASAVLPASMLSAVQQAFADGRRAVPTPMTPALVGGPEGGRIVVYVVNLSEIPQHGGLPKRVVHVTFWDETERRRRDAELAYLGAHDQLTGALTRAEMVRTINNALDSDRGRAAGLSVLVLSLSRFNVVNNGLGRERGDTLLKQLVSRIKAAGFDTVARVGGDIFAMIYPGRPSPKQMQYFCSALLERAVLPYTLGPHKAVVGAAVGLTHTDVSGFDAEVLLAHADLALAEARAMAGNRFVCFTPEMDRRLKERQAMDLALRLARDRDELSVVYEPQCALDSGALMGVEAVPRWVHPDLGVVPPERFLPAAEENGEIVEIGRWLLQSACEDVAGWPFKVRLAVRVAPAQFEFADVAKQVREALSASGLPPDQLDIEIDESACFSEADHVISALRQLQHMGVGIVLQDFARGRSPLRPLGSLPVDKIRIDGGVVSRLPADAETAVIIRTVTALSESHNKLVIAAGVENADQAWMLRMMGCEVGQGPHFGRPRAAAEMARWYEEGAGRRSAVD